MRDHTQRRKTDQNVLLVITRISALCTLRLALKRRNDRQTCGYGFTISISELKNESVPSKNKPNHYKLKLIGQTAKRLKYISSPPDVYYSASPVKAHVRKSPSVMLKPQPKVDKYDPTANHKFRPVNPTTNQRIGREQIIRG